MAKNVIVVGTQWGDEGKGKIVDWLTNHAQGVVRFQGGHNAGHISEHPRAIRKIAQIDISAGSNTMAREPATPMQAQILIAMS